MNFHASIVTYLDNLSQAHATLAAFRESDWGSEPAVFVQPPHWPKGKPSASANYKRALVAAEQSGADFALVLEDDVRVCRHLRHNLTTIPIVARRQVNCLTLFMPDLIADPWEREEPHLGYRLAKPRYAGPNSLWERYRLWGSQAYLFSRGFVRALLERWDTLTEGQDSRVLAVCNVLKVPMYYTGRAWSNTSPWSPPSAPPSPTPPTSAPTSASPSAPASSRRRRSPAG